MQAGRLGATLFGAATGNIKLLAGALVMDFIARPDTAVAIMKAVAKKQLSKFISELEELKNKIESMSMEVEDIKSETESEFDEKSERWQESEKGEQEQSIIDSLDSI